MKHTIDQLGIRSEGSVDNSTPIFIPSLVSPDSNVVLISPNGQLKSSAGGVTGSFSGSFAGNGKALTFDWNTWYPALNFTSGGNVSYLEQHGSYYRIGKFVNAFFHISLTSKDAVSGSCYITNLPYLTSNLHGGVAGTVQIAVFNNMATAPNNMVNITGHVISNSTSASLHVIRNAGSSTQELTSDNFTNTSELIGMLTFFTEQVD